jgi:hypothetical protein
MSFDENMCRVITDMRMPGCSDFEEARVTSRPGITNLLIKACEINSSGVEKVFPV